MKKNTKCNSSRSAAKRRLELTLRHLGRNSLQREDVCGIIGYIGPDSAANYLVEGLLILQNRGYDSAGLSTMDDQNRLVTTKYASSNTTSDAIDRLQNDISKHVGHRIGIAHTRWATHGGKTDDNAHPHSDAKGRISLIHNGVIENASELRSQLEKKGIKFRSETDTEVIAQLIGVHLDDGLDLLSAIKKIKTELEGTWGLAIISIASPGKIYALRNGSPLIIGLGRGKTFVASEASAFSRHTRDMICLENGEIAVVDQTGIVDLIGEKPMDPNRIEQAEHEKVDLSPAPHPHWTIREILEQPMAISRALNFGGRILDGKSVHLGGLDMNSEWLGKVKDLVIAACGTSYHAGLYGARLMRMLKCFDTVSVIDAAELQIDDLPAKDGGLLVISQSGETNDVLRCLTLADSISMPKFSVVNVVGSLIARNTRCGVYTNSGREHAVASTKAFTSQVTVLALISVWFAQNKRDKNFESQKRQLVIDGLHRLSTNFGMALRTRELCKDVALKIAKQHTCFILGKGLGEPIAREGALKIKEISYIHAEGYAAGALKHGPFALIEPGTPIFILILDDVHATHTRTAAAEVKARQAFVVVITDNPRLAQDVADVIIEIPTNGYLTALIATIPLQLIAYELAVAKGINPDKPRNLAKAVTVA